MNQPKSRLEIDFRRLAIIEIVLGGGLCLAALMIALLSRLSDFDARDFLPIATSIIGGLGFLFVIVGLLRKLTGEIKIALFGPLGFAFMITTFGLALKDSIPVLLVLFCCGLVFLVSGIGLWRWHSNAENRE